MTRTTPAHKPQRREARRRIVAAANRFHFGAPLTERQIQQAVCICRQNRLVAPYVLIAAGYNPTRAK